MATYEFAPRITPFEADKASEEKRLFNTPLEAADVVINDSEDEDKSERWSVKPAEKDGRVGMALFDTKGVEKDFREGILIIDGASEVGGYIEPASAIRCRRAKDCPGGLALYIRPVEPVTESSVAWYAVSDHFWNKRRNWRVE